MCERDKLREGLGRVMLCLQGAFVDADGNMMFYNSSVQPVKPLTMALLQIAIRAESELPWFKGEKDTIMDEYREKVLKAIREYEKQFDPVDQYEITDAIGVLYEVIRAIKTD